MVFAIEIAKLLLYDIVVIIQVLLTYFIDHINIRLCLHSVAQKHSISGSSM